jgi:hypothetical protein
MRKASVILLAIVGFLTLLGGLVSAGIAYSGSDYVIGGTHVATVAAGRPEIETALRAARGTAAAYCVGFALLYLFVVLGPYKRGDVWAWWALLAAGALYVGVSALRIPTLGTAAGAGAAFIQGGVLLVSLLLDVGRIKKR